MKRGTPSHPKTLDLAAKLGLEPWGAIGILESLWHFAGQHARRGDIGRHSDASIARAIGWQRDPAVLVAALVECGWLDRCPCHRLRVHDWHDHADQAVQKTQEVVRAGFIACYRDIPRIEGFRKEDGGPPAEAYPLPAQGTGHRADGTGEGGGVAGGSADDAPPTPATPEEARAVALAILGPPERGTRPEMDEAAALRSEVGQLLAKVVERDPRRQDGQQWLNHASRTSGGVVMNDYRSCRSVKWLRATRDRLLSILTDIETEAAGGIVLPDASPRARPNPKLEGLSPDDGPLKAASLWLSRQPKAQGQLAQEFLAWFDANGSADEREADARRRWAAAIGAPPEIGALLGQAVYYARKRADPSAQASAANNSERTGP